MSLFKSLEALCTLDSPSGREGAVREYILGEIAEKNTKTDALGNLIVSKKGEKRAKSRLLIDAHMDEVGFIITNILPSGMLKFTTIGGIDASVIIARRVRFLSGISGVVGCSPIHLLSADEGKKPPKTESLYIDIGASSKEEAEKYVSLGDMAVFESVFEQLGEHKIKAKALDDRIGCAVLLQMIKSETEYDMTFSFTVQEEVGLRGATVAANAINPDFAIVVEATTAADYDGIAPENQVCKLGAGAVLSFMDGGTLYDKELYDLAMKTAAEKGIAVQPKTAVAGGNNAGAIHKSGGGIRTLAVSVPCRYIHSGASVCDKRDIAAVADLVREMASKLAKL